MTVQASQKNDQVQKLINTLNADLESANLSEHQRTETLSKLKTHGRNPVGADAIYCRPGIRTLSRYAFGGFSAATSHEAGRCIANSLLLEPALRQAFIDLGLAPKVADRLRLQNDDDEFLMARILFLLTFEAVLDLDHLIASHDLATSITAHLLRFEAQLTEGELLVLDSVSAMAFVEILKLMFSISNTATQHMLLFSHSVVPLLGILAKLPVLNPPLQPPLSSMINALANIDLAERDDTADFDTAIKLVQILDGAVSAYKTTQLETLAIPLLTVLRKLFDVTNDENKKHLQCLLLPANENRSKPIGHGDDLPSRLLRLTTSTGLVNLSECISGFMFELSDKDPNKYVLNVGYGFAAGYLASHSLPVPENARSSGSGAPQSNPVPINPITGQRLDREPEETGPQMTEEEKEREAERLFVLFERLRATGVVKFENPIRQAMEQEEYTRRVEELSDSE